MEKSEAAISCLQHAIADNQEIIRAYDHKAEILSVLVTLLIGFTNYAYFSKDSLAEVQLLHWIIIGTWVLGLATIFILALVLYPQKNQFSKILLGSYIPKDIYFIRGTITSSKSVDSLATDAMNADWVSELVYESMKLSLIREHKHKFFVWALRCLFGLLLIVLMLIFEGTFYG